MVRPCSATARVAPVRRAAGRSSRRWLIPISALAIVSGAALRAHGDDQKLIDALTEELARTPDAALHLRRGELHRHQREWFKAEADFIAARKLDPSLTIVDYFRARVLLEAGAPEKARPFIERYLQSAPEEPEAWFLRGEIAAAAGDPATAADHFASGIRFSVPPRPEHFLRRAQLLVTARQPDLRPALAALDEGLAQLGHFNMLVEAAIELDLRTADFASALTRVDRALENMPRRERWLARRGEILVRAGRPQEAAGAFRAALAAIDQLPEQHRDTVPMERLASATRAALDRLSAP